MARLLTDTQTASSLKSQQALVDVDTLECPRSVLMVRCPESFRWSIPGAPPSGPAVLVRHL